ncbi:DEAH-box ATP-dependent RNA helicase prp22, partial [Ascosphaera acerosa]
MSDLESLELLSLVSRITTELQNHLGIDDKVLAEFLIDTHLKCDGDSRRFRDELDQMGGELPGGLVESVDRLITTMHPKYKFMKAGAGAGIDGDDEAAGAGRNGEHRTADDIEKRARIFKGLAMPDQEPVAEPSDAIDDTFAMLEGLAGKARHGGGGGGGHKGAKNAQDAQPARHEVDDTLAALEGLAGKATSRPSRPQESSARGRKRSRSPYYDAYGTRVSRSRSRSGSQGRRRTAARSPSYDHESSRRSKYRTKSRERHYRRRDRDGGYDDDDDDDGDAGNDPFRRPPTPELDDAPVLFKIYDGRATGIKDFGVFVSLLGVRGKVDGLVHVSAMQDGARVNHPSDLVTRGQMLKVKVISIEGKRIGLSMKEVDQVTGRDLVPQKRIATGANMEALRGKGSGDRYGSLDSPVPVIEGHNGRPHRERKRLNSPERWEIKQLIASGAVSAADYPDIDAEYHDTLTGEGTFEEEEDVDIEVRNEEPPFLAGQTKQSLELSPIRVIKAPDGSLNRSAMAGTNLAKERRELREQEQRDKAAERAAKVDLNAQWQDPMIAPEHRKFAAELRTAQPPRSSDALPEWKRAVQPQGQAFGKRTSMSIKEQRESLPV